MPIAVADLVVDLAVTDFAKQECKILHSGPSYEPFTVDNSVYKQAGHVVRLHLSLSGETEPVLSQLPADTSVAGNFQVYRYDWVCGIGGLAGWDWKSRLRDEALVVQIVLKRNGPNIGYTTVATQLNILRPSKDTRTWWEVNRDAVAGLVAKGATGTLELIKGIPVLESAAKTLAALSTSLESKDEAKTNWYVYQYLDGVDQAVEWHISKGVLDEYGPLLRGSLMLAFHGGASDARQKGGRIALQMRPLLCFQRGRMYSNDDLTRVSPMAELGDDKQIVLAIYPRLDGPQGETGTASPSP